jgi:3,4-dihydroxyphenylacetate 2,3-dioxygenase
MGEIVGAGIVAHVPTIVLPQEIRFELNDGKEISLVPGLHRLRREVLDVLQPDTIVVLDSHWATTVEFVVAAHEHREGFYTSEELPRGMSSMPYAFRGDPELANALEKQALDREDMWVTAIDNPHLPIHYPTVNLLQYLQGNERWISIGCCQTAEPTDSLLLGELLGRAIATLDRRVVVIASGAFSHTFWPLQKLRQHEASDPQHVFSDQARAADNKVLDAFWRGDHAAVIDDMPNYLQVKPEARFGHYLMMVGALGGRDCIATGTAYSDYENSIGTAQMHVWFDQPQAGWTKPQGSR